MQIKIEIDVRPDELRRFLGLPDVAGLQEDLIQFLRTKVGQASESFDAGAFVKNNIDLINRNPLVKKWFSVVRHPEDESAASPPPTASAATSATAATASTERTATANKPAAKPSPESPAKRKRPPRTPATRAAKPGNKNNLPATAVKTRPSPVKVPHTSELGADLSAAVSLAEDALKRSGNRLKMAALKGIPKGLPTHLPKNLPSAALKLAQGAGMDLGGDRNTEPPISAGQSPAQSKERPSRKRDNE